MPPGVSRRAFLRISSALAAGAPLQLSYGHIALQAESQPVWFRNIRIRNLDN